MKDAATLLALAEEWRAAFGTDGQYEVSNYGRVRRRDGVELKASIPRSPREYPAVMLRYSGKRKRVAVHRLVAINFLGLPPFPNAQVRHLDGNHLNPYAGNLAWGTALENAQDRDLHGRTSRGPRPARKGKAAGPANGNYSVTHEMTQMAHDMSKKGMSQRAIGRALGIHQASVWRALRAHAAIAKGEG